MLSRESFWKGAASAAPPELEKTWALAAEEILTPRQEHWFRFCGGHTDMCRNIKTLFNFEPPVNAEEVRAASLQFVRKISGFSKPSKANEASFLAAVDEIAAVSARLLHSLETTAPPKNREEEAAKAKARAAERFGVWVCAWVWPVQFLAYWASLNSFWNGAASAAAGEMSFRLPVSDAVQMEWRWA